MQAILYIGHGSRMKEAVRQAIEFIEHGKKAISIPIQEICFLELASPSIPEGIKRCAEQGATKIAIVPVLLLTAVHAKIDIPIEIQKAKALYPAIQFEYGKPFGVHSKIIESLLAKIYEKEIKIKEDAMVLLVGRGSSDPDVKHNLAQIAQLLQQRYPFKKVSICFLTAAEPSFEEGLQLAIESRHEQVFVVPYLLFTGILMKSIERTVRQLKTGKQHFILCEYLGYHTNLQEVLIERAVALTNRMCETSEESLE
ncbi:sirohydrochlorin chelatase [Bacillus chungangensis]|uniref:Sirohydrochlorin ferrochelatase n=1 Tax=Bacillus chungangensis TaxID=587633 RepID=A0ABT9WT98_9BACI|nr:sirohydrochlorin chelatase [Bacillus chungangensis]MDQ0176528.1 sirohydrochlorin ferrochelatase [Bacillus chungangensis]